MNLTQLSISALWVLAICTSCGAGSDSESAKNTVNNGSGNNTTHSQNNGSENNKTNGNFNNTTGTTFVPEVEEEYEFSSPAVVGSRVFVANETLNSVAIIESDTLEIKTIPVGFRPTEIVGPTTENGNVWVLNEGSHSVSRINPITLKTETLPSLRHANSIRANSDASWAFVWFDLDKVEGEVPGQVDFASVSAFSKDGQYRIATGFNIRDVQFTNDDKYILIFTDDGVSKLEVSTLTGDVIAPPVAILDADPNDLEILVDPTGTWAVGRADTFQGLVLVNLDSGQTHRLDLPEIPTDIDWSAGGNILVSMPRTNLHFTATIPAGFSNLARAIQELNPSTDAGDTGTSSDAGISADSGADMGADTGDMEGLLEADLPLVEGVTQIALQTLGLGAAEVVGEFLVLSFSGDDNENVVARNLNEIGVVSLAGGEPVFTTLSTRANSFSFAPPFQLDGESQRIMAVLADDEITVFDLLADNDEDRLREVPPFYLRI